MSGKAFLGFSILGLVALAAVTLIPLALVWALSPFFATPVNLQTWAAALVFILALTGHGLLAGRK